MDIDAKKHSFRLLNQSSLAAEGIYDLNGEVMKLRLDHKRAALSGIRERRVIFLGGLAALAATIAGLADLSAAGPWIVLGVLVLVAIVGCLHINAELKRSKESDDGLKKEIELLVADQEGASIRGLFMSTHSAAVRRIAAQEIAEATGEPSWKRTAEFWATRCQWLREQVQRLGGGGNPLLTPDTVARLMANLGQEDEGDRAEETK